MAPKGKAPLEEVPSSYEGPAGKFQLSPESVDRFPPRQHGRQPRREMRLERPAVAAELALEIGGRANSLRCPSSERDAALSPSRIGAMLVKSVRLETSAAEANTVAEGRNVHGWPFGAAHSTLHYDR